jgi:hypothetical protein
MFGRGVVHIIANEFQFLWWVLSWQRRTFSAIVAVLLLLNHLEIPCGILRVESITRTATSMESTENRRAVSAELPDLADHSSSNRNRSLGPSGAPRTIAISPSSIRLPTEILLHWEERRILTLTKQSSPIHSRSLDLSKRSPIPIIIIRFRTKLNLSRRSQRRCIHPPSQRIPRINERRRTSWHPPLALYYIRTSSLHLPPKIPISPPRCLLPLTPIVIFQRPLPRHRLQPSCIARRRYTHHALCTPCQD